MHISERKAYQYKSSMMKKLNLENDFDLYRFYFT